MEHFKDSEGLFSFPEHIFPNVHDQNGPISVGERKQFLLNDAPPPKIVQRLLSHEPLDPKLKSRIRSWSVACIQFIGTWGQLPDDMIQRSITILTYLANHNDPRAAYTLSTAPSMSIEEQDHWLKRSGKLGHPRAWYKAALGAQYKGDYTKTISRLKKGAERQDSACLCELANTNFFGKFGVSKDIAHGKNLLELAAKTADFDYPVALYVLGKILIGEGGADAVEGLKIPELDNEREQTVEHDPKRGIELISKAADLGYGPALLRMGFAYNNGDLGFECAKAVRYFALAAVQEVYCVFKNELVPTEGNACVQVAKWLLCGYENIVLKNPKWSFRFAALGSRIGNATALFALGYFYETGLVVAKDLDTAGNYYRQSYKDGCMAAQRRLEQISFKESHNVEQESQTGPQTELQGEPQVELQVEPQADPEYSEVKTIPVRDSISSTPYPVSPEIPSKPKTPYPDSPPSKQDLADERELESKTPYPESPFEKSRPGSRNSAPAPVAIPDPPSASEFMEPLNEDQTEKTDENVHSKESLPYPESPKKLPYPVGMDSANSTLSLPSPNKMSEFEMPNLSNTSLPELDGTSRSSTPSFANSKKPVLRKPVSMPPPSQPVSIATHQPTNSMYGSGSAGYLNPADFSGNASTNNLANKPVLAPPMSELSLSRTPSPNLQPISEDNTGLSPASSGYRSISASPELTLGRHRPTESIKSHARTRSTSPLRKIFNTPSPLERADKSRQERRSFTEAALADLKYKPKVPVQPIKQERQPGVAYTFEEMGVKTYTSAKNDRCTIM